MMRTRDANDFTPEIEALGALARFQNGEHPSTIAKALSPAGREFIGWREPQAPLRKALPPPRPAGDMDTLHGLADAARRRQEREAARDFAALRSAMTVLAKSTRAAANRRDRELGKRCAVLYRDLRSDLQRDAKKGTLPPEAVSARERALNDVAARLRAAKLI